MRLLAGIARGRTALLGLAQVAIPPDPRTDVLDPIEPYLNADEFRSPKLFTFKMDPDAIVRRVPASLSSVAQLRAAASLFSALEDRGVAVAGHEFVRVGLHDDALTYIVTARVEGIPLLRALALDPSGAAGPACGFIMQLAAYYGDVAVHGGPMPTDFYETQFFFGRRPTDQTDAVIVIDLDPHVRVMGQPSSEEDDADTLVTQSVALVNLLGAIEAVMGLQREVREHLSRLFACLSKQLENPPPQCESVRAALEGDSVALLREACLARPDLAEIVGQKDGQAVIELPGYLTGQVAGYLSLLDELAAHGVIAQICRYEDAQIFLSPRTERPLAEALLDPMGSARATDAADRFVAGLAAHLLGRVATGGSYLTNVWLARLVFSDNLVPDADVVLLADPQPLWTDLVLADAGSWRRFGAYSNELLTLILDVESLAGKHLTHGRKAVTALMVQISRQEVTGDLATRTLELFAADRATPLAFWTTPVS